MKWELYIFPGGYAGSVDKRWKALLWIWLHCFTAGEKRAINTETGEHLIL
jgi:hypothetical protein